MSTKLCSVRPRRVGTGTLRREPLRRKSVLRRKSALRRGATLDFSPAFQRRDPHAYDEGSRVATLEFSVAIQRGDVRR